MRVECPCVPTSALKIGPRRTKMNAIINYINIGKLIPISRYSHITNENIKARALLTVYVLVLPKRYAG